MSLGGCLRLSSSSEDTTQDTEKGLQDIERTPTSTVRTRETAETTTESDEDVDYPIGLDAGGVNSYLADNHINMLANTSFTNRFRSTNLSDSTTKFSKVSHIDDSTALVERKANVTMYVTPHSRYWRRPVNGTATYGLMPSSFSYKRTAMLLGLRPLLKAGLWNAPERLDDGNGFKITADDFDDVERLQDLWWFGGPQNDEMRSFTAEGRVTTEGIISRLGVDYQFISQDRDRLLRFEVRHRVNDIGNVSVSEPDWHQTAKEQAPSVTARIIDDHQFIKMQHHGGNPILPGTDIRLKSKESGDWVAWGTTHEPIEAGTTVYLWVEGDQFQLQDGTKPSAASPQTLNDQYTFSVNHANVHYFPPVELG